MSRAGRPWQRLQELAVAVESAATIEPYPRLARLMQSLAASQSSARLAGVRPAYG
ncbi:MAG TPA: hypothetical protein VGI95_14560 [Caulobacteraceae bacterium]|jgi:hypothetical protein